MSLVPITVNIESSVDSFLAILVAVIGDAKAGKPVSTVVSDAVPALVTAVGQISQLSGDVADKKDLEVTVALKVAAIVDILTQPTQAPPVQQV